MDTKTNNDTTQPKEVVPEVAAGAPGSAATETTVDFHGRPLRRIDRKRTLKTGDHVANKHGQFLWELLGFSHEGVRVGDHFTGGMSDYGWERFYAHFYELVPESEPNNPISHAAGSGKSHE